MINARPIPASFVPLATKLGELAAQNPELAKLVIGVTTKAVERALKFGPTNLQIWQRSFEAAVDQFANREFAKKWTKAVVMRFPGRRPGDTVQEMAKRAR